MDLMNFREYVERDFFHEKMGEKKLILYKYIPEHGGTTYEGIRNDIYNVTSMHMHSQL